MADKQPNCILLPKVSCFKPDGLLNTAFDLWKKNWYSLFTEISESNYLSSDEFIRQDRFLSVFHQDECVAVVGLREVNLTQSFYQEDSYVKALPSQFLENIVKESPLLTIISGFTINTKYRTRVCGLPTICLFGSMIMKHLKAYEIKNAVTIARNDAGINKLTYKLNSIPLEKDILFHGKRCDSVWFKHDEINDNPWAKYATEFSGVFKSHKIKETVLNNPTTNKGRENDLI